MRAAWAVVVAGCAGEGPLGVNEVASREPVADWVELWNDDGGPRSVAGWSLASPAGVFTFPADAELAQDEFAVVAFGGERVARWTAAFALPDEAFDLTVSDADHRRIQQIHVPETGAGQSFGRVPDDEPNWQVIDAPTPGERNVP
ncbi:MAG: hypothetical protein ABMA64_31135 [Myxococcota bacterium]